MSLDFDDEPGLWPPSQRGLVYPLGKSGPETEIRLGKDGEVVEELVDNMAVVTLSAPVTKYLGYDTGDTVFIGHKDEVAKLWNAAKTIEQSLQTIAGVSSEAKKLLSVSRPPGEHHSREKTELDRSRIERYDSEYETRMMLLDLRDLRRDKAGNFYGSDK